MSEDVVAFNLNGARKGLVSYSFVKLILTDSSLMNLTGAQERTRTSTPLPAQPPQGCVSTNFTTWASSNNTSGMILKMGRYARGNATIKKRPLCIKNLFL